MTINHIHPDAVDLLEYSLEELSYECNPINESEQERLKNHWLIGIDEKIGRIKEDPLILKNSFWDVSPFSCIKKNIEFYKVLIYGRGCLYGEGREPAISLRKVPQLERKDEYVELVTSFHRNFSDNFESGNPAILDIKDVYEFRNLAEWISGDYSSLNKFLSTYGKNSDNPMLDNEHITKLQLLINFVQGITKQDFPTVTKDNYFTIFNPSDLESLPHLIVKSNEDRGIMNAVYLYDKAIGRKSIIGSIALLEDTSKTQGSLEGGFWTRFGLQMSLELEDIGILLGGDYKKNIDETIADIQKNMRYDPLEILEKIVF